MRSSSLARPIIGSSLPSLASWLRLVAKASSAGVLERLLDLEAFSSLSPSSSAFRSKGLLPEFCVTLRCS